MNFMSYFLLFFMQAYCSFLKALAGNRADWKILLRIWIQLMFNGIPLSSPHAKTYSVRGFGGGCMKVKIYTFTQRVKIFNLISHNLTKPRFIRSCGNENGNKSTPHQKTRCVCFAQLSKLCIFFIHILGLVFFWHWTHPQQIYEKIKVDAITSGICCNYTYLKRWPLVRLRFH